MTAQRPAMHAGEAVAEALREEGVERVFSVPGSHIHPIYDGISRIPSIRMVTCKMEPNASLRPTLTDASPASPASAS
jgi:thiamine pyrophosphate-dependent acetolactate synthase large subunit-like protein